MEITIIIKGANSLEEIRQALLNETASNNAGNPAISEEPCRDEEIPTLEDIRENNEDTVAKGRYYKVRRKIHHWNQEETDFAIELFNKRVSLDAIAETLFTKYWFRVTTGAILTRVKKFS